MKLLVHNLLFSTRRIAVNVRQMANSVNSTASVKKTPPPPVSTLVFFDIETTGLPGEEWGPTRITELSLCACKLQDLERASAYNLPRVINKINLCLNPYKTIDPTSSAITGLDNELLEAYGAFNEKVFEIVASFLERLPQPICLLAHNGAKFDFPILAKEIKNIKKRLPDEILCVDTLPVFRAHFEALKKSSRKLDFDHPFGGTGDGQKLNGGSMDGFPPIPSGLAQTPQEPKKESPNLDRSSAGTHAAASRQLYSSPPTASSSNKGCSSSSSAGAGCSQATEGMDEAELTFYNQDLDEELALLAESLDPSGQFTPPHQMIRPRTSPPPAPRKPHQYYAERPEDGQGMQQSNETTPTRMKRARRERVARDPTQPPSMRLVDIYMHLTENPQPPNLHCAEDDAMTLMRSVARVPVQFFEIMWDTAVPFNKFM